MDEDIRGALTDIREIVREGFRDTNKRIDALVTQGEFNATVQRIDSEHATLRRDFNQHEIRSEAHMEDVRKADAVVLADAQKSIEGVRIELHSNLEGFRSTTRWAVGVAATGAGVIVAAASALTAFIFNIN